MTQGGAIELPVATCGMIEPSATRRFSVPSTLELGIHNRHRIARHLRRTRLMVISGGRIANEVFRIPLSSPGITCCKGQAESNCQPPEMRAGVSLGLS